MIDFNVLIPVFNTKAPHLMEAVYSVLNQNINTKYKILLVNDGSTNYETIRALDYFNGIPNVVVHNLEENRGTSAALNYGHAVIDSEYIALMGSDDISHRNRFVSQAEFLAKNKRIDVLGTNLFSFYDNDYTRQPKYTSNHKPVPNLQNTNNGFFVNHGTVIYKNGAVREVGGYDIAKRRAQDVDLWPRMAKAGKIFANIEPVLYAWRRYQ